MNNKFRKKLLITSMVAVTTGLSAPTIAQSTTGMVSLEEIVVTARRRDESIQDVPLTVNAVTAEQLNDLNIRTIEDLEGVVAGLTLQEDSIAPTTSMRGIRYDTFAGNTPSVEFYLNDTSVSQLTVMQALFDVGQIEVLRGPQGTLRGKAAPSGSITITSQRPVYDDFGGYVDLTASNKGGKNVRAALNAPIIEDKLAVRIAGFWEENDLNHVKNVYSGDSSQYEGEGYRFSVGFRPTDDLNIDLMYQMVKPERLVFTGVESANRAAPGLPDSDILLSPSDRRSVQDFGELSEQELEAVTLNISWDLGRHQLNFAGSYLDELVKRKMASDVTDAVDASFPADWQGLSQTMRTHNEGHTMELRFQSLERLFNDRIDYVVGALHQKLTPATRLNSQSLVQVQLPSEFAGLPPGFFIPVAHVIADTPIHTGGDLEETSFFANLTYHFGDDTELSAGLRRIEMKRTRFLTVGGNSLDSGKSKEDDLIYTASLKHNFSDDLMGYVSYGTSYRAGFNVVGDFSLLQSDLQRQFANPPSETSESFEIGIKSNWLDNRLQLNVAAFRQEFDDFPYRPSQGTYYVNYEFGGLDPVTGAPIINPTVGQHNFVAPVPVTVDGFEVEANYLASENLTLGALFSYSKGKVDGGVIPCNDYQPHDGIPDSVDGAPSLGQIIAAAGGNNLTTCNASMRANDAPLWTSTLTGEYRFAISDLDAYVRGLWTIYGNSQNDPTNPLDDVPTYNILNLYAGLKDPAGKWEAMLFLKNVADTEKVLSRDAMPGSVNYTVVNAITQQPMGNENITSGYRQVGLTAPREFGINFRYNF